MDACRVAAMEADARESADLCVCVCVCVCKGASEIRTYWQVAARVVEATGKDNYNVIVNNGKDSGQEVCRLNPSSYTNFLIAKGR